MAFLHYLKGRTNVLTVKVKETTHFNSTNFDFRDSLAINDGKSYHHQIRIFRFADKIKIHSSVVVSGEKTERRK